MSHRLAPVAILLSLAACLAGPPPPSAAAPSGPPAPSGECTGFKIRNATDLDSCKAKCRDQERDQLKACSGPGCQGGAGTPGCLLQCDDGAKAAKQAKCYTDS
jgi:hypothetical protein